MSKVYILKKDLPMVPKGTEIKPLSALAYGFRLENGCHIEWVNDCVENNLEWFKLKEDKIEVFQLAPYSEQLADKKHYVIGLTSEIPTEKYQSVKQAIEFVLQNDSYYMKSYLGEKLYSEKELLEAEENAFIAGAGEDLGAYIGGGDSYRFNKSKYKTFSDYKNSKK
jgi:hypothetical protein